LSIVRWPLPTDEKRQAACANRVTRKNGWDTTYDPNDPYAPMTLYTYARTRAHLRTRSVGTSWGHRGHRGHAFALLKPHPRRWPKRLSLGQN